MFKFLEFLCFIDYFTRTLFFKFQCVFEKKTEECASSSVINEKKCAVLEDLVAENGRQKSLENGEKSGESHWRVRDFEIKKWVATLQ